MLEVKTKSIEVVTVISHSFTGDYAQTGEKLDYLISTVMRAGIPYSGQHFGIYYDDPELVGVDDLRGEVCVPVAEAYGGEGDVVRKTLPATEVAYAIHRGPYGKIKEVYKELFDWLGQNRYRHRDDLGVREVFHKIYGQVEKAEDLVTEVQVPIEKAAEPE